MATVLSTELSYEKISCLSYFPYKRKVLLHAITTVNFLHQSAVVCKCWRLFSTVDFYTYADYSWCLQLQIFFQQVLENFSVQHCSNLIYRSRYQVRAFWFVRSTLNLVDFVLFRWYRVRLLRFNFNSYIFFSESGSRLSIDLAINKSLPQHTQVAYKSWKDL